MTTTENLWGALPAEDTMESPHSILGRQAGILTEQTKSLLEGRVSADSFPGSSRNIDIELSVIVPALNNYEVAIVRASHGAIMYPAILRNLVEDQTKSVEVNDVEEFKAALGRILQSDKVKRIISSLLAQARGANPRVETPVRGQP